MVIKKQKLTHSLFSVQHIVILIFVLILSALPPSVYSQSPPITASVNHEHYSTDELVILTVVLIHNDSPQQLRPILPSFDGLVVIDFELATNVREINGSIQTETVYTYQLQPRRIGAITIPPILVEVDGEIYKTSSLSFMVSQGSAPVPSPGNAVTPDNIVPPTELANQDFFVEAVVDVSTPYMGQQIIYTFRFYQAINLYRQPQSEMPIFTGLDTIGLPVREYNLDIGGRIYLITEIRAALFPKTDGNIVIGPALLTIPGNFFEEPVQLYTEPVSIQVKSLPDNAPTGFNGAVGQYEIEAWFSPQVAILSQPSTFQVAISGVGNIHTLPEPIWPLLNGWRTYDSNSSLTTDMKDGKMIGTRVYERLIISDRLGDLIIPPTKLIYFDPIASQYRTISSKSLSVRIIPPPTPNPATATAQAIAALPTATPIVPISKYNPPPPLNNQSVNLGLFDSLGLNLSLILSLTLIFFWAMCAIPVAAILGAGIFWTWQNQQKLSDIETQAKADSLQQPSQTMYPLLAATLAKNSNDNFKAVSQALTQYLEQILQEPVKGLTQTELANRLQALGLTKTLVAKIKDCLAQSEMGRYGPDRDDKGWELLARTDELLVELDKEIGDR